MTIISLAAGSASARISTSGGCITSLTVADVPLLRPTADDAAAIDSACYPLVPFGNRIRDNRFTFEGQTYRLEPNVEWDRHYLHGEGWQAEWAVEECSATALSLSHRHDESRIPYSYIARQDFMLSERGMSLRLTVANTGRCAMPFGLGWHPYFPMTPQTTLQTRTGQMWTEEEGWLPGEAVDLPDDLDFREPRCLPMHWVNNGFEDWSGNAVIRWPERKAALRIDADPVFRTMFLFVSDTAFDPAYRRDFFALEPMTHLADGHNLFGLGGLTVLEPGAKLSGSMRLVLESL